MIETLSSDTDPQAWNARAARYRDLFGALTWQANEALLEVLAPLAGRDFLDIACATGELAATATRRGAHASGLDFAERMIDLAQDKFPQCDFRHGAAEALPWPDASFDLAACSFGLGEFSRPGEALREARRVLRPGGRLALTGWLGPQQGGEFFALVDEVLDVDAGTHRDCRSPLTAPATPLRFADAEGWGEALVAAGFAVEPPRTLALRWTCVSARAIAELLDQGLPAAAAWLRAQPPAVRESIARALDRAGEGRRSDGKIAFRFPALLVVATAV